MLEVLLFAGLAAAQPISNTAQSSDDFKIITGLSPNKARCNSAAAVSVRFGDILRHSDLMLGKCVHVQGHLFGRAIFASAAHANIAHARPSDGQKEARIGLYGLNSDQLPPDGPYALVGEVEDCAKFFASENAMVLGYCHTHFGPFLIVSELRPKP